MMRNFFREKHRKHLICRLLCRLHVNSRRHERLCDFELKEHINSLGCPICDEQRFDDDDGGAFGKYHFSIAWTTSLGL